jgi:hypothetical protein
LRAEIRERRAEVNEFRGREKVAIRVDLTELGHRLNHSEASFYCERGKRHRIA